MAADQLRSVVVWAAILAAGTLGRPSGVAAGENLALHRPYLCSDTLLAGWTGLTDGVTDSDAPPGCFATGGSAQFPKVIMVDLGAVCTISKINLFNSKKGNTRHVSLSISPDAQNFEQLREYYFPSDTVQTLAHSFTPRRARYVKIALHDSWGTGEQGPNCLFLREVQVLGDLPGGGVSAQGNAREELRLARQQPPLVSTPAVTIFRRYRATAEGVLRIAVLGDSGAAVTEQDTKPWPEALAGLLEASGAQVELLNVAAPNQKPEDGVTLLPALAGDAHPPDVLILAYGRDAALAGGDVTAFRRAWQTLAAKVAQTLPALVVVVTPPPLLDPDGKNQPPLLAWAQAEEQLAAQLGLPFVRGGSVLAAAPDPTTCYGPGARLNEAGKALLAQAVQRLVWGEKLGG